MVSKIFCLSFQLATLAVLRQSLIQSFSYTPLHGLNRPNFCTSLLNLSCPLPVKVQTPAVCSGSQPQCLHLLGCFIVLGIRCFFSPTISVRKWKDVATHAANVDKNINVSVFFWQKAAAECFLILFREEICFFWLLLWFLLKPSAISLLFWFFYALTKLSLVILGCP